MQSPDTYRTGGISAIAIHNGVVRIQFMPLGGDGQPAPSVELHIPMVSMRSVSEAARKVASM